MALTFQQKERGTWSFNGVGVKASADELDTVTPTITSGAGAPSATEPNGSLYLRNNGGTADLALYVRQGGAWIVMVGS
jgi:hypothetical protein|tara:strand:+ start:491 stop:724 length:234 start_codon:yes stop_codon:yes gene_type:complete